MESSVTMTTIIDDMPVSASRLFLECIVSRLKVMYCEQVKGNILQMV